MMKKYIFTFCALMIALSGFAQTQTRWKGVDASSLTTNGKYYLYNVGTGRMVIAGGDWGTQALLFYELSGIQLTYGAQNEAYRIEQGEKVPKRLYLQRVVRC